MEAKHTFTVDKAYCEFTICPNNENGVCKTGKWLCFDVTN